jgi:hypothetical protein
MEIINDLEWYINSDPKTAKNKTSDCILSKKELDLIVFDDSTKTNVKIMFPLNNNYLFFVTRELSRPVTVKQMLDCIYKFYKEPLKTEFINNAFEEMEDWKEDIIYHYDNDIGRIKNYDVFTDDCTPDFCGLELNKDNGKYIVHIGPE